MLYPRQQPAGAHGIERLSKKAGNLTIAVDVDGKADDSINLEK